MNTTINISRFGYNRGPSTTRQVDPELVRGLEARGFHRPVRTLSDPRLRLPELLLMEGWERSASGDAVAYTATLDTDPTSGQTVIFHEDQTREVHTSLEGRTHVLRANPDGQVKEFYQ